VLEAAGQRVYGFGSDYETRATAFLVSEDGGRTWREREVPEQLISLAIDPENADRLVASGERGIYLSEEAGRRWRRSEGPAGLVVWTDRLVVVDGEGTAYAAEDAGGRLFPVGEVGGQPAALDAGPGNELLVALHDGTIKRSADGGKRWSVRAAP
jgi:photosystem II stability/assembly factor-like uncharacterized protein